MSKLFRRLRSRVSQELGYAAYRVRGHSMRPTLSDGDLVLVRLRKYREIQAGDLVVAREPGNDRILIKRVLSKGAASFYLGSDDPTSGRDSRDFGSISSDRIIGLVTRHLPLGSQR